MTNKLQELLDRKPFLLADGAVGTNLFAAGLQSGDAPELWNIDAPEKIETLHAGFRDAGSDIILTNSFGGTRHRLKLHNAQNRVHELSLAAAMIARKVADDADHPMVVGGSMGPTGELMEPMGMLTPEEAFDAFKEQAEALVEGGVDILWIETISARDEMDAAIKAATTTGLPIVCTMSFDTNRRTMMGVKPSDFTEFCQQNDAHPMGWGANCGVGAGEMLETVLGLTSKAKADDIIVAKANCGIPEFKDGKISYSGTHEVMAKYARLAADAGARIIGGCCGTTHGHIKAMADALNGYVPSKGTSMADIETVFGPVWKTALPEGTGHAAPKKRERGNRRRAR